MTTVLPTVLLLLGSNLFMTIAWYGHLKYPNAPLYTVIAVAWCIALPEYCLQVPANRLGHATMSAPVLKIIQEAISIAVFIGFTLTYLKETPKWTDIGGFLLCFAGLGLALWGRGIGAH